MRIRLACAAALLLAAFVKRVAPSAVEDRTVLSGVPSDFGASTQLPEGGRIEWKFGDGTPVDPDGQKRSTTAKVTVLRRSVPAALPGDARAALIQEMPWRRMALHRETAT